MNIEEIKRILNPPFASNEGDNYYDSLSGRLSSYINYLYLSVFDKVLSSDDYQKFTDIRKKILYVLQQYLSGHSGEAYKEFENLMDTISFDWKKMGYSINSDNAFIRIRSTSENLNKRTDMFHVPFNKRQLISKQRYSIEGFPCLYLAGCAYTSWLELNRPEFNSIWASSFRPTKELDILDMTLTLDSLEANYSNYGLNHIKDLLCLYFLVIATSYRVKYPLAYFHEEYIISGLLLQWIVLKSPFVGLRYLSTKLEYYDPDKLWYASNIVIPPREHDHIEKYNRFLKESFVLTLPQHWYVLMSYSNAGSVACLECGGDYFKEKTPIGDVNKDTPKNLDDVIFNNYNATWFYNIDGYLRSMFEMDYIE